MDLTDHEVQQRADADRREVDPPIEVETATLSKAGQLDWWVRERREWWGRVAVQTAVNGGSELWIFVPSVAHNYDLSWSFVAGRRACCRTDAYRMEGF
jgi:hypothetical protein